MEEHTESSKQATAAPGAAPASAPATAPASASAPVRLDAFVARATGLSRKQAARLIARGRVAVSGEITRRRGARVPEDAAVALDGARLAAPTPVTHVLLHKPAGVVSSTRDPRDPTVLSLLPASLRPPGMAPAGRLDKDTTGLLILTTDGALIHALTHPRRHVPKRYLALVRGPLDDDAVARFEAGVLLADGTPCAPATLRRAGRWPTAWSARLAPDDRGDRGGSERGRGLAVWEITLREGRYHQVKRMIAACGGHVEALHRHAVGALELPPDLPPGTARPLSPREIERALEGARAT